MKAGAESRAPALADAVPNALVDGSPAQGHSPSRQGINWPGHEQGVARGAQPTAMPMSALPLLVMVASGCAALGYQIVWTQQAALWLGHEGAAALAVVAAFFGGLALGAGALGAAIERSARPGLWYAGCEALIGLWGLVLAAALQPASGAINALLGPSPTPLWQSAVTFGGTFLLLLPATVAMGATLPAMERLLAGWRHSGSPIAALYAGNTLGGVLGVLAVAFWLVQLGGLSTAALACAALNLVCAGVVLVWMPHGGAPATATSGFMTRDHRLAALLASTGLLGIGYEVVVLRVLSQVAENTVYTLALLLVVYLVGTALGAAAWTRWGAARRSHGAVRETGELTEKLDGQLTGAHRGMQDRVSASLLTALALACAFSGATLWMAPWFKAAALLALGEGLVQALVAESFLAVLAFGAPTVVMGALFSHLCEQARAQQLRLSTALAINTTGAALAPLVFGAGLMVGLGAQVALLAIAAGYLLLAGRASGWRNPSAPWLVAAALGGASALAPPLLLVDKPAGAAVLSHREGTLGAVSVVQDRSGVRVLRINNRQQEGSNISAVADARQALLPLLLHPAPRRTLLLGLGTGVTAQAAALDHSLDVLAVELLPEVVQAARYFDGAFEEPKSALPATPRVRTQVADARRFVRSSTEHWDVIISDNFHPARAGSAALYTVEHFQAVRARLAPGGVFCQWLPLHQMDEATLRSIVRSFLAVNPHGAALLATNSLLTPVLGLWAAREVDSALSATASAARLQGARFEPGPAALGLPDEWALLGSFVAGPETLARFAASAPLNTDDHPVVAYLAPRATYAPEGTPAQRLLALLQAWPEHAQTAQSLLARNEPPATAARLTAYLKARQQYLAAGVGVQPLADPARMLAQVQEPLLAVLRTSADFAPAYEPLLRLALALRRTDPQAAKALLEELVRVAPARSGAREEGATLPNQSASPQSQQTQR